uniref:NADH dehydrogenase subunit 2 n=1 Tax=prasinophyte sp. MBIC10622 TaxID=156113 RepID=A0A650AKZ2_9CHLO|nr:NADH dehydrogenase subunit 2 [prasinophyte sp. MBIC10622]
MTSQFLQLFENDLLALLPEVFLITSAIILLMYGVIWSTSQAHGYPILITNVGWLSLFVLSVAGLLVLHNPITTMVVLYNSLVVDQFSTLLKVVVLLSAFCSICISFEYFADERINAFEYIVLLLLSTCSMLLMVSSYDLISMYLAIEFQSLCFYVIAASKRTSEFSTEAGLKYFVLGAFSSGILLFGCSLLYGFTGVTNFEDLAKIFTGYAELPMLTSSGILIALIFLAVGFLFKITAAPFHMWAPDVYEGAPTCVTAFFAITPKVAVLGMFLRLFFSSFYDLMGPWQKIIVLCSLASMIVGALGAISQTKIKRLLAYSSIGHVGYLLIGFACGSVEGVQALLLYLIIYVIMTVNMFSAVLSLRTQGEGLRVKYLSDLSGLSRSNPILAFTLTMTLFSMAGIPPLAGFCSKFYVFFAALGSSMYVLAVVGVLTSVLSCFYYIRLVKVMYFETPHVWVSYAPMDKEKAVLLGLTLFFTMFFFVYPSPLFLLTHEIALSICL